MMIPNSTRWTVMEARRDSETSVPMLDRRHFLAALAGSVAALAAPRSVLAATGSALQDALASSALVYVSPLVSDGRESACHGEVWFVADGGDLLVVTNKERWRAAAISKGFGRARLWVGEHGVWTRANESWKKSPTTDAKARIENAPEEHAQALALFGAKYNEGWSKWGPRFEQGLASGDRVLIRYEPIER